MHLANLPPLVNGVASDGPGLPDSIKRVGEAMAVPNEYPGQIYAFNWSLNADGVTPLKKSAFRITKPLDLKVAGLEQPKTNPLKVMKHSFVHMRTSVSWEAVVLIIVLLFSAGQGGSRQQNARGGFRRTEL